MLDHPRQLLGAKLESCKPRGLQDVGLVYRVPRFQAQSTFAPDSLTTLPQRATSAFT